MIRIEFFKGFLSPYISGSQRFFVFFAVSVKSLFFLCVCASCFNCVCAPRCMCVLSVSVGFLLCFCAQGFFVDSSADWDAQVD